MLSELLSQSLLEQTENYRLARGREFALNASESEDLRIAPVLRVASA
jgi:hypothetical protein